jgi:LCP family protein required for cell wall assembly
MIVASVDTKSGRTTLVSLPRNLQGAPLAPDSPLLARYPSGHFGGDYDECHQGGGACILTNLWREAEFFEEANPGSYPDDDSPGRTEIRGAVQEITGLDIDHVVIIDLKGFEQLIDAMGGIMMNVKLSGVGTRLTVGGKVDDNGNIVGVKGYFEPGYRRLMGKAALWYARTRAADSDSYRQARQRCVVQAIVDQVNPGAMVGQYPELAKIAKDNIYTDISVENLGAFVKLVERIQKGKQITSVSLTAKQGVHDVDPDWDLVRSLVTKGLKPPKPKPTPTATPSSSGSSTPTKTRTKTATPTPTQTSYEDC